LDRRQLCWFKEYAAAIVKQSIISDATNDGTEPLFQGGAFQAPRNLGFNATPSCNVENALELGLDTINMVKKVVDHDVRNVHLPLFFAIHFPPLGLEIGTKANNST
jgi:hypothetical protein